MRLKDNLKKLLDKMLHLEKLDRLELIQQSTHMLLHNLHRIAVDDFLEKQLYSHPRYQDAIRLNRHEFQVHSQSGEDGIIQEIFKRIGNANSYFVEFGVESGLENNTTYLLQKGWRGSWIEGSEEFYQDIRNKFGFMVDRKLLGVKKALVNSRNIESLFNELNVPDEFDLLSIDIDGNDYWVWKNIARYSPRVVVIEYNALFPPDLPWVMREKTDDEPWRGTSYYGASLKSLELLGMEKGYSLVGCNFTGVNAFFVRNDLVGNHFCAPYTAENHYEPPRFHLIRRNGHAIGFGEFLRQ